MIMYLDMGHFKKKIHLMDIFNLEIQLVYFSSRLLPCIIILFSLMLSVFFCWNSYYLGVGQSCLTLNFLAFFSYCPPLAFFKKSVLSSNCFVEFTSLAPIILTSKSS